MNETIALDLNPYCSRAVLIDGGGTVLTHLDSKSGLTARRWLAKALDQCPTAPVVASPLDNCPEDIQKVLRERAVRPDFLSPVLCRTLYNAGRPWNLQRKLHRARLLAYLHQRQVQPSTLLYYLREYEFELARETLAKFTD